MPALLMKPIKRTIKMYGVEGPVVMTIHPDGGVDYKAKGTKLGVYGMGTSIIKACDTPANLPSKFEGRPYEYLQYQAQEQLKRSNQRLQKKISEEIKERVK